MTTGRIGSTLAAVAAVAAATGCVDRRFVVTTNVPGAQVTVDGAPVGAGPADGRWEYAGWREFRAVAPGYEPLTERVQFKPKWYEYPPLDLFAEVLWPFRIEDTRRVDLVLQPVQPVNQLELIATADAFRTKAQTLPPTTVPDHKPVNGTRPPPPAIPTAPPLAPVPSNQVPQTLPVPGTGTPVGGGTTEPVSPILPPR